MIAEGLVARDDDNLALTEKSRTRAAQIAGHDLVLRAKQVDHLALALVAPLQPDDARHWHDSAPTNR